MGSDKARVTYDPRQQYRSVVMQQGRVTLEADWNEASMISGEELRKETLDIIGASGTPDNGYAIVLSNKQPYNFSIRGGTMYVGGVRTQLLEDTSYTNQSDWQDYMGDPDWVSLESLQGSPPVSDEFIYAYFREQEVSAVEDPDLKDVALGGPDTAQRTRLIQRFVRVALQGTDCDTGLSAAQSKWQSEGLTFDPTNMRLFSWAGLQVSMPGLGQNQGPCQPQAQGGYVDPDNQLIRVQITDPDPATGNSQFLWGFDDASFLYRVSLNTTENALVFQSVPVDANHQPAKGQTVEVLRVAAELPNGGLVAATSGFVFTLDQNYAPDSQSVALPSGLSLPAEYNQSTQSPPSQLFLRVWQNIVTFTSGTAMPLGDTGVSVTLTLQSPGNEFHVGDYWLFAVRPATPQTVYPERYMNAAQPADGPRIWACPLGVIAWRRGFGSLVSDCRRKFGPLAQRSLRIQQINWLNDDVVSLAAFRKNSLQVMFDYAPSSQSVSNSSLIVDVELPYFPVIGRNNFEAAAPEPEAASQPEEEESAKAAPAPKAAKSKSTKSSRSAKKSQPTRAAQTAKSDINFSAPRPSVVSKAAGPKINISGPGTSAVNLGNIGPIGRIPIHFPVIIFDPPTLLQRYHFPPKALAPIQAQPWAEQGVSVASQAAINPEVVGFMSLIQPGQVSLTSNIASWSRLLNATLDPYVSLGGGQARVRVKMEGRDIWSAANPTAYLDGQVFGEPGQRADGITPCTSLILPSGDNARASDFESWFWLSFAVWDRTDYSVNTSAVALVAADFNNDGRPDLAVCTSQGTVVILMNNGDGTFRGGNVYAVGSNPISIVAADFRNNGIFDLAVANNGDGTVSILLGNGDGTFTQSASSPIKVGNGPFCIVAADFNSDGIPDLAVTNSQDATVSVLITVQSPTAGTLIWRIEPALKVGNFPTGLATGSLNNSGHNSLAVVNTGDSTVSLLFNDGQGDFTPASNPTVALGTNSFPLYITAADLNNDTFIDLAVGCWDFQYSATDVVGPSAAILMNYSGTPGDFYLDNVLPAGGLPGPIVVADFDGDGNVDLALSDLSFLFTTSNTISIIPGNGDGSFQTAILYNVGNGPDGIVSADFNGDGLPDLAIANESDNTVSILLNDQSQLEPL